MTGIKEKFNQVGGNFLVPEVEIARDLSKIQAFIFDWDGVFNNGAKGAEIGSLFSEADAMGANMLRFNHWRISKILPLFFIITGENNRTAIEFAQREHFNGVYVSYLHKRKALEHIVENYGVSLDTMVFVFDDILDVEAARSCKLALCVKRNASPLFRDYLIERSICQYITGHEGGNNAVREISELLVGLSGQYGETISKRIEFGDEYLQYLAMRKKVATKVEKGQ
jgi:3-deoxy-D-manno-octulosonate 8-phosphate phosphatase (KDO 8-P phosphatase)